MSIAPWERKILREAFVSKMDGWMDEWMDKLGKPSTTFLRKPSSKIYLREAVQWAKEASGWLRIL